MIAWAGIELKNIGIQHSYEFDARARWPLEEI